MAQPLQPGPSQQPLYYTRIADFEARIGRELLIAFFDDTNAGAPNPQAVWRHLLDSQIYVESFMRAGDYDIAACRLRGPLLDTVVRLILDHAEAQAYVRHPETARYDGDKALARIRQECLDIQTHKVRLDLGVPDPPPENVGGSLGRIGRGQCPPTPLFSDLGDFPGGKFG